MVQVRDQRSIAREGIAEVVDRVQSLGIAAHPASLLWVVLDPDRATATRMIELAETMASVRDETMLLVDADVRRRDVTLELGLADASGLSEYLGVGKPAMSLIKPRWRERLDVLPAGRGWLGHPPELAGAVGDLLDRVGRHRVSFVVAGSIREPLTQALARTCQGTILVLRSGVTAVETAQWAVQAVGKGGGRLIGAVVS